jgi:hypothetical protein
MVYSSHRAGGRRSEFHNATLVNLRTNKRANRGVEGPPPHRFGYDRAVSEIFRVQFWILGRNLRLKQSLVVSPAR